MLITNQLTKAQLHTLKQLQAISKKIDGSNPNVYTHLLIQPRALPTIGLYYEKKQLMGFLSIYFFYEDAVEIALLVHPNMRRQGIARRLLQKILPQIQEYNYSKVIFSSPAHLNNHWLPQLSFIPKHSEYYMERHTVKSLFDHQKKLTYRAATVQDIPQLCLLDNSCFHKTHIELQSRFQHILNERNCQVLLAFEQDLLIGKAHLRWQAHGATLSDIAVFPDKQGQGLGTALIIHCINYALGKGKPHLSLDVETHNQKALELYTRLGFLTQNACDYWAIEMVQLQKWIKK